MVYRLGLVLCTAAMLGGCAPQGFESDPVTASTDRGPVTCQHYLDRIVLWDSPVSYPEGMSRDEAVSICRQQGMARKQGSAG